MTEKKSRNSKLKPSELKGLKQDIQDGRGLQFCMKKWNVSQRTYYYHSTKLKKAAKDSTSQKPKMSAEQELEVKNINSHVGELAELIMKYARMIDTEEEASMNMYKDKIKVFRDCIQSIDDVRHGIMAYEFDETEEGGDRDIPSPIMAQLMARFSKEELEEMLFDEQPTKEIADDPASKKAKPAPAA